MLAEKADMKKVDRRQLPREAYVLLRDQQNLSVDDKGLLFRKISPKNQKQVVLPLKFRPLVYSELHVKMGHLGVDRSMQLIKDMFYWPAMGSDISHFITKACSCVKKKRPSKLEKAPLQCISTNAPMELVGLDFLHLDPCREGYEYLLVITDHFTGFTQAYPTANKKAKTAVEKLYSDFMLRFGLPDKILHDHGGEFENDLFKELAKLCGVKRIRTTPHHPKTNGKVERMNQTYFHAANITRTS